MGTSRRLATLTLTAALVIGCDQEDPIPTAPDAAGPRVLPSGSGAASSDLGSPSSELGALPSELALWQELEEADLSRPRLDVTGWSDERTLVQLPVVPVQVLQLPVALPEAAGGIGPGSAIVITIPDEGRFGCTANFVWQDGSALYLGAAGHCFVPADRRATHGEGADYEASGVEVAVCVDGCEGNFRTNELLGTWVQLGAVAYARQTDATGTEQVGHDFGVVEIPAEAAGFVRAAMPVWGGPTGVDPELESGELGCHYGHGLVVGETFLTKARVGIGGGSDGNSWMGDFAGAFGDSGSGLVSCESAVPGFRGAGAVGVLTHLGVQVGDGAEHGVVFGTTVRRAQEMAGEAGLDLSVVVQ